MNTPTAIPILALAPSLDDEVSVTISWNAGDPPGAAAVIVSNDECLDARLYLSMLELAAKRLEVYMSGYRCAMMADQHEQRNVMDLHACLEEASAAGGRVLLCSNDLCNRFLYWEGMADHPDHDHAFAEEAYGSGWRTAAGRALCPVCWSTCQRRSAVR